MDNKIMDCFTNPVKCKILLEVLARGNATAKDLAEAHSDIPQATLYRYLKRMTADGILKVVEEHPVRGTVERVYAPAVDFSQAEEELQGADAGDAYLQLFTQYMLGFLQQFQAYFSRGPVNLREDLFAFTTAPVYVTREELATALEDIGGVIAPLVENKPAEGRQLRSLGIIASPPQT